MDRNPKVETGGFECLPGRGNPLPRYAPDDGTLAQLEANAKAAKRGLWADAEPVPPWEWRTKQKQQR